MLRKKVTFIFLKQQLEEALHDIFDMTTAYSTGNRYHQSHVVINHATIVRVGMAILMLVCWFQCDETARLIVVVAKYVNKIINKMLFKSIYVIERERNLNYLSS
jgi:hypothetical protein